VEVPGSALAETTVPTRERSLVLRRSVFAVWAIGFLPLFAALRSHLHVPPLYRILIGTGVFCAPAVAALWLLGRDKQRTLRAWRTFLAVRVMLLIPLILTVVDGIADEGWPRGRFNRGIAKVLLMVITMAVPTFLAGVSALIRTYRVAGVLALVAGLSSIVDGVLLLRASWRFSMATQRLSSILDILGFTSKVESYLAIPMGIALVVGGVVIFRAAGASTDKLH
jgi:hypothetical protein